MPAPKHTDSDQAWKPKRAHKWHPVPVDAGDGKIPPGGANPFDPEDPESDWSAYDDGHGHLKVDCGDGIEVAWDDLFPQAPAKTDRHVHTSDQTCRLGQAETDVQVEVTKREMWCRDYRCSFVIETSMTWKITKQKYKCVEEDNSVVDPHAQGHWATDGSETTESVSRSRKTEFKCC